MLTPMRPDSPLARCPRLRLAPRTRRSKRLGAALALFALPLGLMVAHRAGAQQDGVPNLAARRGTLTAPMAVDWKFTTQFVPDNPASPAISNDTAFIAAGNRLYAVDLATGAQKWRYPTDTNLQSSIQGSPTVNGGTVYLATGEGLYALDAATGKQKWQPYLVKGGIATSPTVIDNGVYFASQTGNFYAVDAGAGDTLAGLYRQSLRNPIKTGGDVVKDMTVVDGTAYYVTANNQALHAVDLTSGAQRWAIRLPNVPTNNALPVASGDSILLNSGNLLLNIRRSNGAVLWSRPFETELAAQPAVDADGNIFVVTSERQVYAFDSRNKPLWRKAPLLDYEVVTAPIIANNLLIIGTGSGALYTFDPATGNLLWNYAIAPSGTSATSIPTKTNIAAPPVVVGNTLYVQTDDGTLTAFRHEATDALPPIITAITPEAGDYVSGRPPFRVLAKVEDAGSGLNLNTLQLKLDDKVIPRRPPVASSRALSASDDTATGFIYSPEDNSIDYSTQDSETGLSSALPDGHHSVTLTVADWKGNVATRTWSFLVDDTIPRRTRRTGPAGFPGRGGPGGGGGKGGFGGG